MYSCLPHLDLAIDDDLEINDSLLKICNEDQALEYSPKLSFQTYCTQGQCFGLLCVMRRGVWLFNIGMKIIFKTHLHDRCAAL